MSRPSETTKERSSSSICGGIVFSSTGGHSPTPRRQQNEPSEQKATASSTPAKPPTRSPYIPRHAKDSFLKTATPRQMKKANEIL
ncbi:hypothetical protein F5Y00DRAFT_235417 [Daldinia vernicosa]|uniref:uncharacterized protein n=1 Tax=Daldinia vernicosa TaxID=114800 RepID=UPI002008D8AA|nr:uncharacterized protein F5Y00DRAFT_235417 [Daldinia vernicosa]KAI0849655.1 hypothetical protein F5Y00DRAFT_235417 [Daldinia vernicosa]